jgi:hypothetical protein
VLGPHDPPPARAVGRVRRCTERDGKIFDFYLYLRARDRAAGRTRRLRRGGRAGSRRRCGRSCTSSGGSPARWATSRRSSAGAQPSVGSRRMDEDPNGPLTSGHAEGDVERRPASSSSVREVASSTLRR